MSDAREWLTRAIHAALNEATTYIARRDGVPT